MDRSTKYSKNSTSLGEDFTDARLYIVRRSGCQRLDSGEQFPEISLTSNHEVDSADPENLRKFLAFGKARFAARHTALMLYGHADGRAMCPDEDSGNEMGFAQLTDAVAAEGAVDLMALELCNMGGVEIAYQWRPGNGAFHTKVLVAIPNAGPAMDWSRVFAHLGRSAGRYQHGTRICRIGVPQGRRIIRLHLQPSWHVARRLERRHDIGICLGLASYT
jgi:clostripain